MILWFVIGKLIDEEGNIYEGEYKNGFSDGQGKRKVVYLMIYL